MPAGASYFFLMVSIPNNTCKVHDQMNRLKKALFEHA